MRSNPQVGIYFSDYECWGHTSRVMAVSEVFKNKFPQGRLFFIQAGLRQQALINRWGTIYRLPGVLTDRRHFRQAADSANPDVTQRPQACLDIINSQKPDLFITEFFPLGHEECRHELIPGLIKASQQGAALWSVAGYPLLTGTNYDWRHQVLSLYQRTIIFSPIVEKQLIADFLPQAMRRKYLDFFKKYEKKITFAGYLLPQSGIVEGVSSVKTFFPKKVCRVAVVRGGGAYYPKLMAQAIRTSDLLGKEFYLTIVAGPSTTVQEWDFFTRLERNKRTNNLKLLKSTSDYEGLIKNCDVCVSVASYHTSVMLMKHKKKTILVPFTGNDKISCYEQPARALMLKEMIGAQVLSIQNLTAVALAKAIEQAARAPSIKSHVPKEYFAGAKVLDKALTGLFGP